MDTIAGKIVGAALLRLTAEAYLLLAPKAGTPRVERYRPEVLQLPKPLVLEEKSAKPTKPQRRRNQKSQTAPIRWRCCPAEEDLKPLYDAALEMSGLQAELGATQADPTGEKAKTQTLSRERDDALRVAKGGSVMQRALRAAKSKWFAMDAAQAQERWRPKQRTKTANRNSSNTTKYS